MSTDTPITDRVLTAARKVRTSGKSGDLAVGLMVALTVGVALHLYGPGGAVWEVPLSLIFAAVAGTGAALGSLSLGTDAGSHGDAVALVLIASVLLAGCGSTAETREVTIPAESPTTRATTDTLQLPALPSVPEPGVPTKPIEVRISDDTLPGPTLRVRRLSVDRRTDDPGVTLQYESGGRTLTDRYDLPAYGEALDVYPQVQRTERLGTERPRSDVTPDTVRDTVARAAVRGEPKDQTADAEVPEDEEGLWSLLKGRLAWIGGLVLLGAGLYAIRTFTSIIPW